jgi:hypothetical protein
MGYQNVLAFFCLRHCGSDHRRSQARTESSAGEESRVMVVVVLFVVVSFRPRCVFLSIYFNVRCTYLGCCITFYLSTMVRFTSSSDETSYLAQLVYLAAPTVGVNKQHQSCWVEGKWTNSPSFIDAS